MNYTLDSNRWKHRAPFAGGGIGPQVAHASGRLELCTNNGLKRSFAKVLHRAVAADAA